MKTSAKCVAFLVAAILSLVLAACDVKIQIGEPGQIDVTERPQTERADDQSDHTERTSESDPLNIPIIPDSSAEMAFIDADGIHVNPKFRRSRPHAYRWVVWHEIYHFLHPEEPESREDEDAADRYASLHASPEDVRGEIEWLRWQHAHGGREVGEHAHLLVRANTLAAILKEKLQTERADARTRTSTDGRQQQKRKNNR